MTTKIIFLEEFGKAFVPKKYIPNLRLYLLKAGFNEVPYKFFGAFFYISAFITSFIFIVLIFPFLKNPQIYPVISNLHPTKFSIFEIFIFSFLGWFLIQLFFAVFFILLIYFYLDVRIYHRTKKMEELLPDFLQVLSSNLKGGMTFERALWTSIKPRFGVLASEMAKASKKVMTGYEINKALTDLAEKYDSLMLRRTVDLIISEIESGGNVAELIDRLVDNLKETKALKDEMSGDAIAYVIFISVIVIFLSPLLFGLSYNLLILISGFVGKLSAATQHAGTLPFSFSEVKIKPYDFQIFSVAAIVVVSFFSSLIVSIVEKGDIKGGLKYIPFYVFGSIGFYFLFMKILGALFGKILFL